MSAHPPGHPPAHPPTPTGPGRTITPGPADPALCRSSGPGIDSIDATLEAHHTGIGEPHEHSTPAPRPCTCGHDRVERMFHLAPCPRSERGVRRPRVLEVVSDLERLVAQALAILEQPIDPDSYPAGPLAHAADIGFEVIGFQFEAAQRELAKIGELRPPADGTPS